jgi:hypothetical protein
VPIGTLRAVHPLLAEPTPEQTYLLEVIYEGRAKLNPPNYHLGVENYSGPKWPFFQYVEHTLYRKHRLNAVDVLSTCPVIRGAGGAYGWVWHAPPSPVSLMPEHELALTIAGIRQVAEVAEDIALFLDYLKVLVTNEAGFAPSPDSVSEVTLTSDALVQILRALPGQWDLGSRSLDWLRDLAEHEPATWHSRILPHDRIELSRFLRSYGGITTAVEYVERVIAVYAPPVVAFEPLHPSSLSLPEAIDYLNAVWRIHHSGSPLIRLGRVEVAAKLALDCATAEEFESRLSSLTSVLDGMNVPDSTEGGKLFELKRYLSSMLPEDAAARTDEATDDLRAVFDLRVWRQHEGTEARARRGMERLGLTLPPADWGEAWAHVQSKAVLALSALREEIETLPD